MAWDIRTRRRFLLGVAAVYAADYLWATWLIWQVAFLTHSGTWIAAASAASAVPTVLVGLTGPEWGFRGRMSAWLAGLGLLTAALAFGIAHHPLALIGLALVQGWISSRVIPLSQTLLMSRIPLGGAPQASSHYEIASRSGIVVGPLLAGILIAAHGPVVAMATAGLGFVLASLVWLGLEKTPIHSTVGSAARMRQGWRAIGHDSFLGMALWVRAGSNVMWPAFTVAIPLMIRSPWHSHALGYGAIRALWGLSTVAGALIIVPRLVKRLQLSYFLSWLVTGLAFVAIGSSRHLVTALIWTAVGALSSPIVHVALDSHIGTVVSAEERSAVYAIQRLLMAIVNLLGLALMSGALYLVQPDQALRGAGILMAAGALVGLGLWQRARRPAQEAPTGIRPAPPE